MLDNDEGIDRKRVIERKLVAREGFPASTPRTRHFAGASRTYRMVIIYVDTQCVTKLYTSDGC